MSNIIIGLVAIALGLWGASMWWWSVAEMVRGLTPVVLILFGFLALGAGVSAVREKGDEELSDEELDENE
jgi:hypothetical protein